MPLGNTCRGCTTCIICIICISETKTDAGKNISRIQPDCFTALGLTPKGRRARGRPKTTWRRTVERERNKAGWKSWNVAKAAARDRGCWSEYVWDLCAYWREET